MLRLPLRFLLASSLALAACAAPASPEDDGSGDDDSASAEDHLDSLDIANSWTDAANPATPELAGPLWWAWVMNLHGPKMALRSVSSGRPREPVAIFDGGGYAETGAFSLEPGKYGVLVQYRENESGDAALLADVSMGTQTLGSLVVDGAHPIGAGGWRRAYFHVELAQRSDVGRVRVTSKTPGIEWQIGLVAVHAEGRPFWGMAHNPDSIARLDAALAAGANALEPDLRMSSDAPGAFSSADDEWLEVTEQGLTGHASTSNGQATFSSYLRELQARAPRTLVLWDTKSGATGDYADVAHRILDVGAREHFDFGKSVFNISSANMTPLYAPFQGMPIGRCFDGIFTQVHSHTAAEWMTPVRDNRLTFQGLGVTPQLQVTEKWSVPISVYVRAREQEAYPNKIYFWTVNDANAMRRVLDLGIDSLITDDIPLLRSILAEEPYASMYRWATDADDHSVKHAAGFFHVGTR